MTDFSKYSYMESVLQDTNKNYIRLKDDDQMRNNIIIKQVVGELIGEMRNLSLTFDAMSTTIFYGGSFYDGVKVKAPDEYDFDLLFKLPAFAEPIINISDKEGYVYVKFLQWERFKKQTESTKYKELEKCFDEGYISNEKIRRWMQGLVDKAIQAKPDLNIRRSTSGPAVTLILYNGTISIDLVPSFEFSSNQWPKGYYRENPVYSRKTFLVVPKPPEGTGFVGRYWRLSFQEQERELLKNKRTLKPCLKLLKHLRNKYNHNAISSYYIKTIFLWHHDDKCFTTKSLSYNFMFMFRTYIDSIASGEILYYWNDKFNLLDKIQPIILRNIANQLNNFWKEIDRNLNNPNIIENKLSKLNNRKYNEISDGTNTHQS